MIVSEGINHGKLQSIIVGELKKAGLKHRLKKIILKSVKDNKTLFGAPLVKAPSCSVICCGSTLSVPIVVTEMSAVLRSNAQIEGLFRKAGSQSRQKDIKRLLDAGGCVSDGHHPIDVASVLKLYLRCLPEPLISAEVQDLLLRSRLAPGEDALQSVLNTLLLLPVSHVHLLHYIMELLNFIASHHKQNLMDSTNLAIVMAPSVMPLPAAATPQRLDHHVALVKIFIENAKYIGVLSDELMARLDDEDDSLLAKRKKRRSGSINRVLSGLRKMVSGNAHNHTPAPPRDGGKTPVIIKSAVKRKFDGYEGLSSKKKKEIKQILPQKELMFTPMKLGLTERKKLRLSFMDARSGWGPTEANSLNKISISSQSSGSSEMFTDTIDLSLRPSAVNDYVRISKQEYEEIKSRVSAIESRLSQEFTDITPRVEPLQQVQNVYQKTLDDVARLDEACPTSDHLARRLSKELKIRPNEHPKIIRSPSARKIGTIRRRSKENTKIVRHKSWNVPQQASHNADRFYPYAGLRRQRTSTAESQPTAPAVTGWDAPSTDSINSLDASQKYQLRNRSSLAADLNKTIGRQQKRRSLNSTLNTTFDVTASDHSRNNTMNSSIKSDKSCHYQNVPARKPKRVGRESPKTQQKWKSAAAFFMEKTGEIDSSGNSGRPSVNKLRSQNAGAVLAKARLFETSSDKSSEQEKVVHTGFARRPRVSGHYVPKSQKNMVPVRGHVDVGPCVARTRNLAPPAVPPRQYKDVESWRARRSTPPAKKVPSPQPHVRTPQQLLKKPMLAPRGPRTPATAAAAIATPVQDARRTPMKGVHISPRRRSPRQKLQR